MNGQRGKAETKHTDTNDETRNRGGERGGRRPGGVTRGGSTEEKTLTDRGRRTCTEGTQETLKGHERA